MRSFRFSTLLFTIPQDRPNYISGLYSAVWISKQFNWLTCRWTRLGYRLKFVEMLIGYFIAFAVHLGPLFTWWPWQWPWLLSASWSSPYV